MKLFDSSPDQMNSFLILPVEGPELIDSLSQVNEFDMGTWFKHADGVYKFPDNAVVANIQSYFIERLTDKNHSTISRLLMEGQAATTSILFALKFFFPDYPKRFEHDSIYFGIRCRINEFNVAGVDNDFVFNLKWLRFLGDPTTAITDTLRASPAIIEDILDQYYTSNYDVNNLRFYFAQEAATIRTGYKNFEITGVETEEKYNSIEKFGLFFDSSGFSQPEDYNLDIYQLAFIFRRSVHHRNL